MSTRRMVLAIASAAVVVVPLTVATVRAQASEVTEAGFLVAPMTSSTTTRPPSTPPSASTWDAHGLAAQLVLAGVDMSRLGDARTWAQGGIGGIVLFGTPPSSFAQQIAAIRTAEQVPPLVASDEEGGEVQRLASVIYPLHSAEWMGANRSPAQVQAIAMHYGWHMHALGVDMDLAPVSDLLVPGHYIADTHRAFASNPTVVGRYVNAWQHGMRHWHVIPTAKHWPGHGHATDTHTSLAVTPQFSYLEAHDLVPFEAAFAQTIPAVMVGHLVVPGLTESATMPASLSWHALHYLRQTAGANTLIVTDSLAMGAIRTSLGLTQPQAAVRALRMGADMALVQTGYPQGVVHAIADAIRSGAYPRARAIASVQRVLAAKRISTAPYSPSSLSPQSGATGVALQPSLSAVLQDRLGGRDRAVFAVRKHGSPTWNVVAWAGVVGDAGTRVSYQLPLGKLQPATSYDWRMRSCNAAAYCSQWTLVRTFTTA